MTRLTRLGGLTLTSASLLALAACGGGASASTGASAGNAAASTRTASSSSADTAATSTTNCIAAKDASLNLGSVHHAVPAGWVSESLQGLTFALPPDPENPNGGLVQSDNTGQSSSWSGVTIPETKILDGNGGYTGMTESVMVQQDPTVNWDGCLRDGIKDTFTAAVTGASILGGSISPQDAAAALPGEAQGQFDLIRLYVQSGSGRYYALVPKTSPGDAGIQFLRQLLGTLSFQ